MQSYIIRKLFSTSCSFAARRLRVGRSRVGSVLSSLQNDEKQSFKEIGYQESEHVNRSAAVQLNQPTVLKIKAKNLSQTLSSNQTRGSFARTTDVGRLKDNEDQRTSKDVNVTHSSDLSVVKRVSKLSDRFAVKQMVQNLNLDKIQPAVPKKSYNLATYVNQSEILANLLKLKVDLSKVEHHPNVAEHLVKMKSSEELEPYIKFLHDNGVLEANLGTCITRNPGILLESIDDLEVRINYFKSKKFSLEAISRIVSNAPQILSISTVETDTKLGFLQQNFALSGDEVRTVITRCPKLAVWNSEKIKEIKFTFKEFLGFSELEMKTMIVAQPKVYLTGKYALIKRFDYLHNVVSLSHQDIILWPRILRTRLSVIRQRYLFLRHLRRDQFDPKKENYVSPKALGGGRDSEFCDNVAKVPTSEFNVFLKTL